MQYRHRLWKFTLVVSTLDVRWGSCALRLRPAATVCAPVLPPAGMPSWCPGPGYQALNSIIATPGLPQLAVQAASQKPGETVAAAPRCETSVGIAARALLSCPPRPRGWRALRSQQVVGENRVEDRVTSNIKTKSISIQGTGLSMKNLFIRQTPA